jgi:hypothetical protein
VSEYGAKLWSTDETSKVIKTMCHIIQTMLAAIYNGTKATSTWKRFVIVYIPSNLSFKSMTIIL